MEEALNLHNSDHPNLSLVSVQLTGLDYMSWKRSMIIALRAKDKLRFINGTCARPTFGSPLYDKWMKADSMVISWILNSIAKNVVETFLYSDSAKDLWDQINHRFGESNGPLLYQVQKAICNLSQGNLSVVDYYTKMKKLWDELNCLKQLPVCTCGASSAMSNMESNDRLIQFLMGLNDTYETTRNQVLMMEPPPSISKAYSMIFNVAKQKKIQLSTNEITEIPAAMAVQTQRRTNIYESSRRNSGQKEDQYCTNCKTSGHTRASCFKIIGYPDWWEDLRQKRKAANAKANAVTRDLDSPLEMNHKGGAPSNEDHWDMNLNKNPQQQSAAANTVSFAGTTSTFETKIIGI
ncbi:uncharacterized protein LOC119371545 [Jatropha curcas]|uniref:uncharacterized protein LOC119371545 n=1 Tax=Jatropha curcas TaxID=180498 RepID=UPI001895A126|nr:uncharacterized protein LOC119371545 [Jatropha curcas]